MKKETKATYAPAREFQPTNKIEILRDTGCEVLEADGTTRTIDVKKGQVVENATPSAAEILIRGEMAKLVA